MRQKEQTRRKDDSLQQLSKENERLILEYAIERKVIQRCIHLNRNMAYNLDSEDLWSACFLEMARSYVCYDPNKGSLENFFFVVCRNAILMCCRRELRYYRDKEGHRRYIELESEEGNQFLEKLSLDPKPFQEEIELTSAFEDFLSRIPERDQRVFRLKLMGKAQKEVGEVLNLSQSAISNILKAHKPLFMKLVIYA